MVIILAGGRGERLLPLTERRSKPAVPFAGKYRIIDFPLSNCINSGLQKILIIVQVKSASLIQHINLGWNIFSSEMGEYCRVLPPRLGVGEHLYTGTADAVFQNLYHIEAEEPDRVLILSGDQIYKMDYGLLLVFHSLNEADLTIAALETEDIELARRSGVLEIDYQQRVIGFEEKPAEPKSIPGCPNKYLISMGIYCFDSNELIGELEEDSLKENSSHDFGKDIIPEMVEDMERKVCAFVFKKNTGEPDYWLDIGTIDSYYQAHMDLLTISPQFNLYDQRWPWRTYQRQLPPAKIVFSADVRDSIVGEGCIIDEAEVVHSIISPGVRIGKGVKIFDSLIMNGTVIEDNSFIMKAIVDKENIIPAGSVIHYGKMSFSGKYEVTDSGIVVIPRRHAKWHKRS
jgi:glucose-1-phosphate adenylyltransferase